MARREQQRLARRLRRDLGKQAARVGQTQLQRLRHVAERLAVHVFVEEREAKEIERVVGLVGGSEQLEREVHRVGKKLLGLLQVGQIEPPAGVVRNVRRVVPAIGVRRYRRKPRRRRVR